MFNGDLQRLARRAARHILASMNPHQFSENHFAQRFARFDRASSARHFGDSGRVDRGRFDSRKRARTGFGALARTHGFQGHAPSFDGENRRQNGRFGRRHERLYRARMGLLSRQSSGRPGRARAELAVRIRHGTDFGRRLTGNRKTRRYRRNPRDRRRTGRTDRRAVRLQFVGEIALGPPDCGSPATVEKFGVEDLRAFMERHYSPSNCVVVAVGDVKHDRIVKLAERGLADLPGTSRKRPATPKTPTVLAHHEIKRDDSECRAFDYRHAGLRLQRSAPLRRVDFGFDVDRRLFEPIISGSARKNAASVTASAA